MNKKNEKRLSFEVKFAEIKEENPDSRFMTVEIQAFSSGINLHELFCSEETLKKTAPTIYDVPIIYNVDAYRDDFGTHALPKDTLIAGFVVADSANFIKLDDGRLGLMVSAKIWKNYASEVVRILKKEDGETKVSVEMILLDYWEMESDIFEMKDFSYMGICLLGKGISEASPGAKLNVLSFAKQNALYKHDYDLEFSSKYETIDFSIPNSVKINVQKGLDLYKEFGRGGNPVALALARHLIKKDITNASKIRHIHKVFSGKNFDDIDEDLPSDSYIIFMLYGGNEGYEWSKHIANLLEEDDEKNLTYFEGEDIMPYKNLEEINDALKGIEPPITLGQANSISAQADAIGVDEDKNGWAIAIANFKKTHKVVDGSWVKKEDNDFSSEEDLDVKEDLKTEDVDIDKTVKNQKIEKEDKNNVKIKEEDNISLLSLQTVEILNSSLADHVYGEQKFAKYWVEAVDEKYAYIRDHEDKKEYRAEYTVDEEVGKIYLDKKEEVTKSEYKVAGSEDIIMSVNDNIDIEALVALFEDEEEASDILKAEFEKEDKDKDFSVIINSLYLKTKNLFDSNKEFVSTNEQLQDFKDKIEKERFEFEVNAALKELQDNVEIPAKVIEEMREKSVEYDLETINGWKNDCKAQAFTYAIKQEDKSSKKNKYGLPWEDIDTTKKSFWDELK